MLCAGCAPAYLDDIPAISGHVLDGKTGAPIVGAKITAEAPISHRAVSATSGRNGKFSINGLSHLELIPLGSDAIDGVATLTTEATGYLPELTTFYRSQPDPTIKLLPREPDHRQLQSVSPPRKRGARNNGLDARFRGHDDEEGTTLFVPLVLAEAEAVALLIEEFARALPAGPFSGSTRRS
jgi:hypothetical protein